MTREEIKKVLPVIQSFAEGKVIQTKNGDETWITIGKETDLNIESLAEYPDCFRIKPEPKYRPFKDAVECWLEMLKHQPFGWVKTIANIPELHNISAIFPSAEFPVLLGIDLEEGEAREYSLKLSEMYDLYTFADGAPFGVREGVWEK